jgi:site-specific recombinase XerD
LHVLCLDDGTPLERHHVRHMFDGARTRAGLRKVRWHDARHHFSSRRTDAGMGLLELQGELGHAEPRTTAGYYHPSAARRYDSVLDEPAEGAHGA